MKHIKLFYKNTLKRKVEINLKCIFLIICSSLILTIFTGILQYTKMQYSTTNDTSLYINLKLGNVQTIFKLSVMGFLVSIYYKLIDGYTNDYIIMRSKGASMFLIRSMILFNTILHVIISLPICIVVSKISSNIISKLFINLTSLDVVIGAFETLKFPIEIAILILITGIVLMFKISKRAKNYPYNSSKLMQGDKKYEIRFNG